MSFENIQLPPFLIQDLYKNFLIDYKTNAVLSDKLKIDKSASIGGNRKNILILLKESSEVVIQATDLTFLEGILKACKLTVTDICICNISLLPEVDYLTLSKRYEPSKIMLFGVEPSAINLPLHFPHNQIQQHNAQVYVSFPSLKEIAAAIPLKQALWSTLQKLFNLK